MRNITQLLKAYPPQGVQGVKHLTKAKQQAFVDNEEPEEWDTDYPY